MERSEKIYATGLSIKPHYSFAYTYNIEGNNIRSTIPIKHIHAAELSKKARRRIITAMQWMTYLSPNHSTYCKHQKMKFKFKINFLTLTLSGVQMHSDKYIVHKMLRPMLKYLIRKGCTHYLWKAETQDNGNLHFHITTNHYIFWRSLRNKWNSIQKAHGYLKKYFDDHGNMDANSTDVHAVKNNKSIISYMTKYMLKADKFKKNQKKIYTIPEHYYHDKLNLKDEQNNSVKRIIECALWNCSNALSKYKMNITEESDEYNTFSKYVQNNSNALTFDHGTLYEYNDESVFNNLFRMYDESKFNLSLVE